MTLTFIPSFGCIQPQFAGSRKKAADKEHSLSFFALNKACERIEQRTPKWSIEKGLTEFIADAYPRLKSFFDRNTKLSTGGIHLIAPGTEQSLHTLAQIAESQTRFEMLTRLNPAFVTLPNLRQQQRVKALHPFVQKDFGGMESYAKSFYQLLRSMASFFDAPAKQPMEETVKRAFQNKKAIESKTPEWFMHRSLAKLIATRLNQLTLLDKPFEPPQKKEPEFTQSPTSGLIIPASPKEERYKPPLQQVIPPDAEARIQRAKHAYAQIKDDPAFSDLQGKPFRKQVRKLHKRIATDPNHLEQLAKQLHEIAKPLSLLIVQQ